MRGKKSSQHPYRCFKNRNNDITIKLNILDYKQDGSAKTLESEIHGNFSLNHEPFKLFGFVEQK